MVSQLPATLSPTTFSSMDDVYQVIVNDLDMCISTFQQYAKIEKTLATSLDSLVFQQMLREEKTELRFPRSGWWKAFLKIRENMQSQADIHRNLANDAEMLVERLSTFRSQKDKVRRRIKESIRQSVTEHSEYTQTVARLRKQYENKVEEARALEHDAEIANTNLDPPNWPPEHWTTENTHHERADSSMSSRGGDQDSEFDSPPQSMFIISGATSTVQGIPVGRSGSVFETLAKRDWGNEKSRLVRAVAKGVDGVGKVGKPKSQTKVRKEAEQADRDYRQSIVRLDTLRLQRDMIRNSAAVSFQEIYQELSQIAQAEFSRFVDSSINAAKNIYENIDILPQYLNEIDAISDGIEFKRGIRPPVVEPLVYYQNAFVGECKNLIFGVSLTDYLSTHPNVLVPHVVLTCIEYIEACGLDQEGLYRIPGKLATIQQLVHKMEKEDTLYEFEQDTDVAAVAGCLKLYLRQLPFPLFPYPLHDRIMFGTEFMQNPEGAITNLSRRVKRLSPPHQATLKIVCQHLGNVALHSEANRMNANNLGTVFTPVIFGDDAQKSLEAAKSAARDILMETLILHHHAIFTDISLGSQLNDKSKRLSTPVLNLAIPGQPASRPRSATVPSQPPQLPALILTEMHPDSPQTGFVSEDAWNSVQRNEDWSGIQRVRSSSPLHASQALPITDASPVRLDQPKLDQTQTRHH